MLQYILQTLAFQLFFLLVYDVFLKKETFFNWNRAYLLGTSILSLVLPFVKIPELQKAIPQSFVVNLPTVVIGEPAKKVNEAIQLNTVYIQQESFNYLQAIFYIGLAIAFLIFAVKLVSILKLASTNPKRWKGDFLIVKLLKSTAAFSFFNYIFIGENLKETEAQQILEHEKVHVTQKHSWDLLYFELLRIAFWFNPLIYVYQNRTAELHEFIADSKAVKQDNKSAYYQNLLAQVFDTKNVSFTNSFLKQSLIKKRIVMLTKQQSKQIFKLKYALLIPVVFTMLVFSACENQNISETENEKAIDLEQYKVVLSIEDVKKGLHEESKKQKEFLDQNPNYVLWNLINMDTKEIIITVHHKDEIPPEGFRSMEGKLEDSKISYLKFEGVGFSEKVETEKFDNASEVPFAIIDEVPVFPGCEDMSLEQQKKCISQNVAKFVNDNFNTKLADELNIKGRVKIYVGFKVDKQGNIIDVRARAPKQELADEAKRVVNLLPKMQPGKHKGKTVTVPYSLPIVFQVNE